MTRPTHNVGSDERFAPTPMDGPVKTLLPIVLIFHPALSPLSGAESRKPLDILLERLSSESSSEKKVAAYGLGALGSRAAVGPLKNRLQDEDPEVRAAAAVALLQLGEAGKPVVDTLGTAMRDTERNDRVGVRFSGIEFTVEMRLIEMPPPATSTIPAMIGLLREKEHALSNMAATVLELYGADAKEAVPDLIGLLRRSPKDKSVRYPVAALRAMSALRAIGPAARDALPALEEAMRSDGSGVGVEAATAILAIQPDHPAALARVSQTIRSGEAGRSLEYGFALSGIREVRHIQANFVPILVETVEDHQRPSSERLRCIRLLGDIGPTAKHAIRTLRRELRSHESLIRTHAAIAMMKIDKSIHTDVLPILRTALQEDGREEAEAVTKYFQGEPPGDVQTRASLQKALRHSNYTVACQASVPLLRSNPAHGEARSLLLRLLKEGAPDNPEIPISLNMASRVAAASAVARLGLRDSEIRTALIDLLSHSEMLPVVVAADALRRIDNQ